jgi:mono/diheme cytochrome c family protein
MTRSLRWHLLAAGLVVLGAPLAAQAAGDAAAGQKTFDTLCWTCHGKTGVGDGPAAPKNPAPRDFTKGDFKYDADKNGKPGEDADLALILKNGAAPYGGSPLMTPWGHLSEKEIQDVIAYVRSLKK